MTVGRRPDRRLVEVTFRLIELGTQLINFSLTLFDIERAS